MRSLKYYFLLCLLLVLPLRLFSQLGKVAMGDDFFNKGQYAKALEYYKQALGRMKRPSQQQDYRYFYLLFQVAESKRLLHDTASSGHYKVLVEKFNGLMFSENRINDYRIYLLAAESEKHLMNFLAAESMYSWAFRHMLLIPDKCKLDFAWCSLQQNRYGQALRMLNQVSDTQLFELFNQYKNECINGLSESVSAKLEVNDTLTLSMRYTGCFGGTAYRCVFVKTLLGYDMLMYREKPTDNNTPWMPSVERFLTDSAFSQIIDFEKELRAFDHFSGGDCTVSGYFSFQSGENSFTLTIRECALGIGDGIVSLLTEP